MMRRRAGRRAFACASTLLLCLAAGTGDWAGELKSLKLTERPTNLLGRHLSVRLPGSGQVMANQPRGAMDSILSSEEETFAVVDAGGERLIVKARELSALASKDADTTLAQYVSSIDGTAKPRPKLTKVRTDSPGVDVYALLDAEPSGINQGLTLVLSAYTVHADDSVQEMGFVVNEAGGKDPKGARALALRILATLAPGSRRLRTEETDLDLDLLTESPPGTRQLRVHVPSGHLLLREEGPDFRLYRIREVVPISQGVRSELVLYHGRHPKTFSEEAPQESVGRKAFDLLGGHTECARWTSPSGESTGRPWHGEVFAATDGSLVLHFFAIAASEEDRERLLGVAGGAILSKKDPT